MRLVPLLLLGAAASARADPHPMSAGANPVPIVDAQVALVKEILTIDVGLRAADVKAVVTLENKGPATKLLVGFPCDATSEPGMAGVPCKTKVTITADGKKLKVARKKSSRKEHHWTWPMSFAAGQKVELVVAYAAPLINENYGVPVFGMGLFHYRLQTGALWAGPIGDLEVTVRTPFDALVYVSPTGYQRSPGAIHWSFQDYEPTEDVVLVPSQPAASTEMAVYGGKSLAEIASRRQAGDYARARLTEIVGELRRHEGNDAASRASSYLPILARHAGVAAPRHEDLAAIALESARVIDELVKRAKR